MMLEAAMHVLQAGTARPNHTGPAESEDRDNKWWLTTCMEYKSMSMALCLVCVNMQQSSTWPECIQRASRST
jgi:hypothetical protein